MKKHIGKLLVVLVILIVLGIEFFLHAGEFLVVKDSFVQADVAVVLSGDPVRRSLAARDLYKQARAGKVLVVPEPTDTIMVRELLGLGLFDPKQPPLSVRILIASGVPESQIQVLPGAANGTIEEALKVKRYFTPDLPRQIVIVTSPVSSRRARFIFREVFDGTEVFSYPTSYDMFEPGRWWSNPRNALYVVEEYQKFLVNLVTLPIVLRAKKPVTEGESDG